MGDKLFWFLVGWFLAISHNSACPSCSLCYQTKCHQVLVPGVRQQYRRWNGLCHVDCWSSQARQRFPVVWPGASSRCSLRIPWRDLSYVFSVHQSFGVASYLPHVNVCTFYDYHYHMVDFHNLQQNVVLLYYLNLVGSSLLLYISPCDITQSRIIHPKCFKHADNAEICTELFSLAPNHETTKSSCTLYTWSTSE